MTWTDECKFYFQESTQAGAKKKTKASVKEAASTIAYGLVKYYTGNNTGDTPGNLPDPYYCMNPRQRSSIVVAN